MITIPVLMGFDSEQVIGEMTVDETKLPKVPNYHFALGYTIKSFNPYIGKEDNVDLVCVSLVNDSKFKAWHDATQA